jgi:hypothetical protein
MYAYKDPLATGRDTGLSAQLKRWFGLAFLRHSSTKRPLVPGVRLSNQFSSLAHEPWRRPGTTK